MSRRLLLVDDAQDIRAIASISLARVGDWTVVPASCGEEALEVAAHDGPFDVVLLDVMMPGMDGPATMRALRAQGLPSAVKIVFLTARAHREDLERLQALGAAGVIAKPFDPLQLPSQLQLILDE